MRVPLAFLAAAIVMVPARTSAQNGRVVTYLSVRGKDTTDIEQYRQVRDTIFGVWVETGPDIAVHNYWVALGPDGLPTSYAIKVTHPYGDRPPVSLNQHTTFGGDTAAVLDSVPAVGLQRIAIHGGAFPEINFVLHFDLGLARLRAAGAKSGSIVTFGSNRIVTGPNGPMLAPPAPESVFAAFSGADSVIVGPARMSVDGDGHVTGIHFDDGQEVHRGTTANMAKVIAGFVAANAAADSARTIELSTDALDKFVGNYASQDLKVSVSRNGDHLFMTVNAQPPFPIVPEAPTKFFVRGRALRMEFETAGAGDASALIIRQGKSEYRLIKTKGSQEI